MELLGSRQEVGKSEKQVREEGQLLSSHPRAALGLRPLFCQALGPSMK